MKRIKIDWPVVACWLIYGAGLAFCIVFSVQVLMVYFRGH